jgi:hypothetical protein
LTLGNPCSITAHQEGQLQPIRPNRLEELKVELAARFQTICRDMSGDDFANLIDEMAQFRIKYEDLEAELARRLLTSDAAERRPLS